MSDPKLGYVINWVADIAKARAFYTEAFGFSIAREQDMGAFQWLEFSTGNTALAFAGQAEVAGMFPDGFDAHGADKQPLATQISIVSDAIEPLWDKALAAGATGISAPAKMPWGQTWAQMRDPNGVLVSLATPLN
jgi:lactoylglutathione lyase